MDKKSAIRILQEQKGKYTKAEHKIHVANQTAEFIEKFLGKDSHHYTLIKSFTFGGSSPDTSEQDYDLKLRNVVRRFSDCVNDTIDTINKIGLKKEKKENFLSNISEAWLIFIVSLIISIIVGSYYIGYWVGERSSPTSSITNQKSTK